MSETPDGSANTQGKDGAGGDLESEAGEGESWVVLWQGHDGPADEEGYVDLACK